MSTYTNYEKTAVDYDKARKPVGVQLLVHTAICTTGKPLDQMHILDAGCGSGQYSEALLKKGAKTITMMDGSKAMLGVAKNKVQSFIDRGCKITLIHKFLPDLPEGKFDLIMFNQVLHHVESSNTKDFPKIQACFESSYKHLTPGGLLVVDNSTPHQLKETSWFFHLAPESVQRFNNRFPALPEQLRMIEKAGFRDVRSMALVSELMYNEDHYNNLLGALDEKWRCGNSFWAHLDDDELEAALKKLKKLNAEGKLESFFREKEEIRLRYGQTTKTFAQKESSNYTHG